MWIKSFLFCNSQARSSGTFANGGSQLPFRTQIGIYRQGGNGFTRNLEPGGVVLLGEELMLRAHVKFGDGKKLYENIIDSEKI